jgi:hypothetical protein
MKPLAPVMKTEAIVKSITEKAGARIAERGGDRVSAISRQLYRRPPQARPGAEG